MNQRREQCPKERQKQLQTPILQLLFTNWIWHKLSWNQVPQGWRSCKLETMPPETSNSTMDNSNTCNVLRRSHPKFLQTSTTSHAKRQSGVIVIGHLTLASGPSCCNLRAAFGLPDLFEITWRSFFCNKFGFPWCQKDLRMFRTLGTRRVDTSRREMNEMGCHRLRRSSTQSKNAIQLAG